MDELKTLYKRLRQEEEYYFENQHLCEDVAVYEYFKLISDVLNVIEPIVKRENSIMNMG